VSVYVHIFFTIYRRWSVKRNRKDDTSESHVPKEIFPDNIFGPAALV